jgi:hypothetical protein
VSAIDSTSLFKAILDVADIGLRELLSALLGEGALATFPGLGWPETSVGVSDGCPKKLSAVPIY